MYRRNKVKYMASFVSLIHGVDNFKILKEINKQAKKHNRIIRLFASNKNSSEDSKFGMTTKRSIQNFTIKRIFRIKKH